MLSYCNYLFSDADNFIKHEEQLYKEIYASAGQFIGLENVPSEKEFLSIFGKVTVPRLQSISFSL